MQKVIGVRFKKAGKIHYFNPGQIEILRGDFVIVETQRGLECVEVVISPREIANDKLKVDSIIRKADQKDLSQMAENQRNSKSAFDICIGKIKEHKLPMNLISVEYTFDASKIIFSFTAEGRVDFRELVKDLASVFRTRIGKTFGWNWWLRKTFVLCIISWRFYPGFNSYGKRSKFVTKSCKNLWNMWPTHVLLKV